MPTYFLLLFDTAGERPSIVRRCPAENKQIAAIKFAERLKKMMKGQLFLDTELLSFIKQEDELTQQERQWIRAEDPELLDL